MRILRGKLTEIHFPVLEAAGLLSLRLSGVSAASLLQGVCNSHLVLEEPSSVVQLDYSQKVLLVSTAQRSLLFHTEEKSVKQVGTQPRRRYAALVPPRWWQRG